MSREESLLKTRAKSLRNNYNLSIEEAEKIYAFQNNLCAICVLPQPGKRLAIDHRHVDGKIRGALCSRCNRVLGKIEDPRWKWGIFELTKLIEYLKNPPAVLALGKEVFGYPGKCGTKKQRKALKKAAKLLIVKQKRNQSA